MRFLTAFLLCLIVSVIEGQSLKVMTYNIRFDNPQDSVNAWPNRKSKVISLITKYDPDLIGTQEALLHQLMDITTTNSQYGFVGVGRDDGNQKGEFSALLFKKEKFELLDQNTFWLSETPEVPGSKSWDAAITRVATWALLRENVSGRKFIAVNTHFDHMGVEARKQSAILLKNKVRELAYEVPVIITGDFNCTRDEDPYKIITDGELIELDDPAPDSPGTFCTFKVNSEPCKAIDYVFFSNEWIADRYKVIDDNDGKYYPSDHLPVMVTLSLTK
jgi:endonuclease/exonuclease/phosphatase family metal-dependent hydrolase